MNTNNLHVVDNILSGVGFASLTVTSATMLRRKTIGHKLLVWCTAFFCLARATACFVSAYTYAYHSADGHSIIPCVIYFISALLGIGLAAVVLSEYDSILSTLMDRHEEEVRQVALTKLNAANIQKSEELVAQQQGGH